MADGVTMTDSTKNGAFPTPLAISIRLYHLLLHSYPKEFQEEYGTELAQVFADSAQDLYYQNGWRGLMTLWSETATDLPGTAIGEHFSICLQDLRYGLRMLLKNLSFSATAIFLLALGIGATTTIFSIVNTVLLRPLPYEQPEQLVVIQDIDRSSGGRLAPVAAANFLDWRTQNQVFSQMALLDSWPLNYVDAGNPERLRGASVSPNLMALLGIKPILGRTFLPDEEKPGREMVVVLSYDLWQRRFAGKANVIGRVVRLDGKQYTVIGVMPEQFDFPGQLRASAELWIPMAVNEELRQARGNHTNIAIARLKPGVSMPQAQMQMTTIAARLAKQYPDVDAAFDKVIITSLHEVLVGNIRQALFVLLAAVSCLLLIACANVANLLLVRASIRQREIALRSALGASRSRLVRQLLTESLLLSTIGGLLGLLLSEGSIQLLKWVGPSSLPRLQEVNLDLPVMGFALGLSILTGVLFGLAPALQVSQGDLNKNLKEGGRSSTGGANRLQLRSLLVIAEVALALLLLTSAGLLARSFLVLQGVDPGFNPQGLVTTKISLAEINYPKPQQQIAFFQNTLDRLRALPGVKAASVVAAMPLSGSNIMLGFTIQEHPPLKPEEQPGSGFNPISFDYFQTMGIPLIRGRQFSTFDREGSPKVVVISALMAKRFFPGEDPIGKHLVIDYDTKNNVHEVIGIVGDVHHMSLDAAGRSDIYAPFQQVTYSFMSLVVRSDGNVNSLAPLIRREVLAIDSSQATGKIVFVEQLVADNVAQPRFQMFLISLFAGLALILAAVGIYGVMAYSVTQRTNELGIRLALGAQPKDVLKMILSQGMLLVSVGIALGLLLSLATGRLLASFLFGISATDAPTFIGVSLILALAALLACYLPAQKATRVNPIIALRQE
jgi:putative ABC transport system permease protein